MDRSDAPESQEPGKSTAERGRLWFRLTLMLAALVVIVAGAWAISGFLQRMHDKMRRHGCWNNLREIGLVCRMWENEHNGQWPRLSTVPGEFMFAPGVIEDVSAKMSILCCPVESSDPVPGTYLGDTHYVYLGPGLATEEEALTFLDAYLQAALAGEPLPTPVYRPPEEPLERGSIEGAMPIGFHRPGIHNQEYLNVLFADGHVESIAMGTRYPATMTFWEKLTAVEAAIAGTAR